MASGCGTYCAAWGCNQRFDKDAGISFHTFPLKNKERLKKWLIAMRRDDFKPIHEYVQNTFFQQITIHFQAT